MTNLKSKSAVQIYGCFSKSANISSVICGSVREIRQNRGKKSQFSVSFLFRLNNRTQSKIFICSEQSKNPQAQITETFSQHRRAISCKMV